MSAGCVPVVFRAAGPAEIVTDGVSGFHFTTKKELRSITEDILRAASGSANLEVMRDQAMAASRRFDEREFPSRVKAVIRDFLGVNLV